MRGPTTGKAYQWKSDVLKQIAHYYSRGIVLKVVLIWRVTLEILIKQRLSETFMTTIRHRISALKLKIFN